MQVKPKSGHSDVGVHHVDQSMRPNMLWANALSYAICSMFYDLPLKNSSLASNNCARDLAYSTLQFHIFKPDFDQLLIRRFKCEIHPPNLSDAAAGSRTHRGILSCLV